MSTEFHSKLLGSLQNQEKVGEQARDLLIKQPCTTNLRHGPLDPHDGRSHVFTRSPSSECRRYAQSTSGRSSSHFTRAPDSRSMSIASDSPQVLRPYAIFRKCAALVPQRFANSSRASRVMVLRKDFRSISHLNHSVKENSIPNGQF